MKHWQAYILSVLLGYTIFLPLAVSLIWLEKLMRAIAPEMGFWRLFLWDMGDVSEAIIAIGIIGGLPFLLAQFFWYRRFLKRGKRSRWWLVLSSMVCYFAVGMLLFGLFGRIQLWNPIYYMQIFIYGGAFVAIGSVAGLTLFRRLTAGQEDAASQTP